MQKVEAVNFQQDQFLGQGFYPDDGLNGSYPESAGSL